MDSHSKIKLLGYILIVSDVSNNVNLDKILKFDLDYKELRCIWTSPNYLDRLWKDECAMNRQLRPHTFFVRFTTCINNWPTFIKTLKRLYKKLTNKKTRIKNCNSPTIKILVNIDHVIYVRYYAHRMNSLWKLLKNSSIVFGEIQVFFWWQNCN